MHVYAGHAQRHCEPVEAGRKDAVILRAFGANSYVPEEQHLVLLFGERVATEAETA